MPFGSLWLPVLASAVAVFVASAVLHMVLKYHRADHRKLTNEDAVSDALGKGTPARGLYMIPWCEHSQMNDPAVKAKFEKGPIAIITVLPSGQVNMGKHLGLWFGFCVLASFTTAYLARHTLSYGANGRTIMQVTGAVSLVAYGYGNFSDTIWKGQPWANTVRSLIDSVIYALITGAIFCALWPKG